MPTRVVIRLETTDLQEPLGAGLAVAAAVTVTGDALVKDGSLATASTATLWASATDLPSTFILLYLKTDQDLVIVLEGTAAADSSAILVKAGIPFLIASQSTLAYAASDRATGAAQTYTKVKIRNNSGQTANYLFLVIK